MKAKIKIGTIELEFEYETVDQLCEIYDYISQEPVVTNEQKECPLEGPVEKLKKAIEEAYTPQTIPYSNWPNYLHPLYDPLIRFVEGRPKFMAGGE